MELAERKALRAQLTRQVNTAKDLLAEDLNIEEISAVLSCLKLTNEKLNAVSKKVVSSAEEESLEDEFAKMLEYEEKAVATIARLEHRISAADPFSDRGSSAHQLIRAASAEVDMNDPGENLREARQPEAEPEHQTGNINNINRNTVRLPKLELKKFDGYLNNWAPFWEQFKSVIHENNDLDQRAKFNYLQTVLTGKAAAAISGLVPSENCYVDAIDMLKNEFGNSEKIIDHYIKSLMSIAPVKNKNDVVALRKLYNSVTSITRSLSSLGISANHYGLMVKSVIMKTLPYVMRIDYNKLSNSEEFSDVNSVVSVADSYEKQIDKLLNFIKIEVESIEQAQGVLSSDNPYHKNKYSEPNATKIKGKPSSEFCTAAGLFTAAKNTCLFCNRDSHLTVDCNKPLTLTERKDILKRNNRCFRCLKPNHSSRFCRTDKLKCEKCSARHVTIMCDPEYIKNIKSDALQKENVKSTSLFANNEINNVYLQTACAFVYSNDNSQAYIRLIIDGGSQLTFIRECLSRKLNLPIVGTRNISVYSFGNSKHPPSSMCKQVLLKLRNRQNSTTIEIRAIEVPEICFDILSPPTVNHPAIEGLQLADAVTKEGLQPLEGINLLIGADNYWRIVTGEYLKLSSDLVAVNTKLGWAIHGQSEEMSCSANLVTALHVQATVQTTNEDDCLESNVKRFWDLESLGLCRDDTAKCDTRNFISQNITYDGERYEVKLPWKEETVKLNDNYDTAHIRLKALTKKLVRDAKLHEYDEAMWQYIKNDCAERSITNLDSEKTYFMPHRAVYRENKDTSRVRIVFDASSHGFGYLSLNEHLNCGENLVPLMLGVLINFRKYPIGLTADIEKAFLQIALNETDRDSHSFLWYKEPIKSISELPEIAVYRMNRVTFGVTCSPFLLAAVIKKHLQEKSKEHEEVCSILQRSFYVDDLVVSLQTSPHGKELYDNAKLLMSSANMNLRKWQTNDEELSKYIGEKEKGEVTLNNNITKVLGILWNKDADELHTDVSEIIKEGEYNVPTKRMILRITSRIFDPLGLITPFTIRAKILIQEVWKLKLDWDTNLPDHLATNWGSWCNELRVLEEFNVPRCLVPKPVHEIQLHIFADASPQAYGAVAYVRVQEDNQARCNLLMSKSRVAPLNEKGDKSLTLPKLELTAALCATRLQQYILENLELPIQKVFLWSDSKITLYWIQGQPKNWKPYVANRVKEIQDLTRGNWKYCPGKENPADLLTRGLKARHLINSELWKNGPDWLIQNDDYWPIDDSLERENNTISLTIQTPESRGQWETIFPANKYSNFEKLLRVTAFVKRFVNNARNPKDQKTGCLSTEEIDSANNYWLNCVQNKAYPNELFALRKQRTLDSRSSILTLNPFLDENGLMRLTGRLQESYLSYDTKYPIILPKHSDIVNLIIWKCHNDTYHGGVNITLNEVRKRYWIIQGRQLIKRLIKSCAICKRFKGKPGSEPFAPLPKERINAASPFKTTGTDFAGPLYIKNQDGTKRKSYIMLFTCAVTRAVHLELLNDISTESCIHGLRRFIARRGLPETIYSDNAKTFKRTALELTELAKALKTSKVQDLMTSHRIKWKFIAERASWWGGWWERLIKSVKNCLKIALGKSSFNEEEMRTLLTEVEATVNSRPLTYISESPEELSVLSPAHFLLGSQTMKIPDALKVDSSNRNEILQNWKARQEAANKFWRKWSEEYLQQLRSAHHRSPTNSSNFKINDVVLLHDQNASRLLWKLAKIVQLFPGRDGKIRACEIQLANGLRTRRPIQLLYPLEVDSPPGEDVKIIPHDPEPSRSKQLRAQKASGTGEGRKAAQ